MRVAAMGHTSITQALRVNQRQLTRRQVIVSGLMLGTGSLTASSVLAACSKTTVHPSGKSPSSITGTAVMQNYPGWIGASEVSDFEKLYPGTDIKQTAASGSIAGRVQVIAKSPPGSFDFALADQSFVGQALAIGLLQTPDWSKIPNISNVESHFRASYTHGTPTDYGRVGIGFRRDLVPEGISGWADVWRLAPKYSGQITFLDVDRDTMGSTLKYLGYSGNSTSQTELEKCKQALLSIKPHLQALTSVNVASGLAQGTVAIAMDYDEDVALAQRKNPRVEWIEPQEGMVAYLEGWVPFKTSRHLDLVYAFMNFNMEPRNYADFVNTTGTAYVMPAATPFIDKSISQDPILRPNPAVLDKVEFEQFLGQATALWSSVWDEVKSA